MSYKIRNKYDTLDTVMLGDTYHSQYFDTIKNDKIKSGLKRMADETQEDLENFQNVLKQFGCRVIRPELNKNDRIENNRVLKGIPRPPLQPRDAQFVMGNHLFVTGVGDSLDHPSIIERLLDYDDSVVEIMNDRSPYLDAPNWTINNNDLWVNNCEEHRFRDKETGETLHRFDIYDKTQYESVLHRTIEASEDALIKIKTLYPNLNINVLQHEGHSDGCFAILKDGAIITRVEIQNYKKNFPNYDICTVQDDQTDFRRELSFWKVTKHKALTSFWLPGEEDNHEFQEFVETWLEDWVGFVEESIFDVNVLVLDEHNVCVSNPNNSVINSFFKKHNIEPIYVPWRHRFFWDGGLHCITLDLRRS